MTILHPQKNSEHSLDLLWRSEIIQLDGHGWSRYNNSNEFSKRYISLPSTDPTTIQTGLLLIDLSDDSREACDKLPHLPSPSFFVPPSSRSFMRFIGISRKRDVPEGGAGCWEKQWVELSSKVYRHHVHARPAFSDWNGPKQTRRGRQSEVAFSTVKRILIVYNIFFLNPAFKLPLIETCCALYQNNAGTTFL